MVVAIIFGIYLISAFFVNPFGNYIANDEWLYFRQVEAFSEGIYRINSLIDPTFILQGVLGVIWSKLVGFSFNNLHALSFVLVLAFTFGLLKVLQLFKLPRETKIFTSLVFLFNPVFYHLSFTFMTELYFLTLVIWAVYFSLITIKKADLKNLLIAGGLIGATILIRQIGIVLLISLLWVFYMKRRRDVREYFVLCFPSLVAVLIYLVWPRYTLDSFNLFNKLTDLGDFYRSLPLYLFSVFYFSFFASPLIAKKKLTLSKLNLVLITLLVLIIFKRDVFPIGNILILEGILAENDPIHYLSLLNNPVTKVLFSGLISISFLKLANRLKQLKLTGHVSYYLALNFGLFFIANLVLGDFYDRYLIIPFLFLLIHLAKNLKVTSISWTLLVFLVVFSTILEFDYITRVKIRWQHAYALQESTGKLLTIGVDPAYGKYFKAKKTGEYSGFVYPNPTECCSCRVIQFPVYLDSRLQAVFSSPIPPESVKELLPLERLMYLLNKYNPSIPGETPKLNNRHYDEYLQNRHNLRYRDETRSLNYRLFGTRYDTFSYCE